jgi:hypothetical protein
MAYFLYKKYKANKAQKAAESASPGPRETNDSDPSAPQAHSKNDASPPASAQPARPQESMKWRLALMLSLLFPIILETLDYTGDVRSSRSLHKLLISSSPVVATAQPHIAVCCW